MNLYFQQQQNCRKNGKKKYNIYEIADDKTPLFDFWFGP